MEDVVTRIEIIDDFTRPLKDLKDSLVDAYDAQDVFRNSVKETNKEIAGTVKTITSFIDAIRDNRLTMDYIVDKEGELVSSTKRLGYTFKMFGRETGKAWRLNKKLMSDTLGVTKVAFGDLAYDLKVASKLIWNFTKTNSKELYRFYSVFEHITGLFKTPAAGFGESISVSFGKLSGELTKSGANLSKYGNRLLDSLKEIPKSMKKATEETKIGLAKDVTMAATRFIHFGFVSALNKSTDAMIKKSIDAYVRGAKTIMSLVDRDLEKFTVFDKSRGIFGEGKAKFLSASSYAWAQEHGQDWAMVHRLGADATFKGIGTKDFRRIMTLADKIETLTPGETIENAATRIIDSIKSGHDAGSVTQMFGGGQMMERKMRRMGYERALRGGDVSKALDIAEKVAEQAGLTQERYDAANKSISRNYATINNTIENVKQKLGMVLSQHLEPVINKISDFVTSPEFKKGVTFLAFIIDQIGSALETVVNFFIDNIKVIGAMIGLFILTKLWLVINTVLGLGGILGAIRTLIFDSGKAVAFLHGKFAGLVTFLRKSSFIDKFLITPMVDLNKKTRTAIRQHGILGGVIRGIGFGFKSMFLNPITISAVMAGVLLYYMEDIVNALGKWYTGSDKTVKLWASIPGMINMARTFAINFFENVFIGLDHIADRFMLAGQELKNLFNLIMGGWGAFFEFFGAGLNAMMDGIAKFGDKMADAMPKYSQAWLLGKGLGKLGRAGGGNAGTDLQNFGREMKTNFLNKMEEGYYKIQNHKFMEYKDLMRGVDEASQIESWGELFKAAGGDKILGFLDDISKKLGLSVDTEREIKGRTDLIAETTQQEEELRWLKAFSDRQIGSAYNSMTSSTVNTTINGASQQVIMNLGRRDPKSVSPRAKKYA